jgi:hypothetical protein
VKSALHSVSLEDQAYAIALLYNSQGTQVIGYLIVGTTTVIGSSRKRGFLLFLDTNGNVTSFDTVQDVGVHIEFRSVGVVTQLGGQVKIWVGGACGSNSLFLNYSAGIVWYKCMDIVAGGGDYVTSITLPGSSYVIGDFNAPNVSLAKLQRSDGAINWVKNYQEFSGNPGIIRAASNGDILIPARWAIAPFPDRSVVIKTTQDFGGLPTECNINNLSYSTVTLTLSTSTSDTSVNLSPSTGVPIVGDASTETSNVAVVNNCQ